MRNIFTEVRILTLALPLVFERTLSDEIVQVGSIEHMLITLTKNQVYYKGESWLGSSWSVYSWNAYKCISNLSLHLPYYEFQLLLLYECSISCTSKWNKYNYKWIPAIATQCFIFILKLHHHSTFTSHDMFRPPGPSSVSS
jgi:hypothetical protein